MTDLNINAGATFVSTKYRRNLVGAEGAPLSNALFQLPGRRLSNSSAFVGTGSLSYNPLITQSLRALFYADVRHQSKFNSGSDLDLEKVQKAYTVVNARIGIMGRDRNWAVELWAGVVGLSALLSVATTGLLQAPAPARPVRPTAAGR